MRKYYKFKKEEKEVVRKDIGYNVNNYKSYLINIETKDLNIVEKRLKFEKLGYSNQEHASLILALSKNGNLVNSCSILHSNPNNHFNSWISFNTYQELKCRNKYFNIWSYMLNA